MNKKGQYPEWVITNTQNHVESRKNSLMLWFSLIKAKIDGRRNFKNRSKFTPYQRSSMVKVPVRVFRCSCLCLSSFCSNSSTSFCMLLTRTLWSSMSLLSLAFSLINSFCDRGLSITGNRLFFGLGGSGDLTPLDLLLDALALIFRWSWVCKLSQNVTVS